MELTSCLAEALLSSNMNAICCIDDANSSIVRSVVYHAIECTVEVRAEDGDILVILTHHVNLDHHPVIFTTCKGKYDISAIQHTLTYEQKRYLLMCHAFTRCDIYIRLQ